MREGGFGGSGGLQVRMLGDGSQGCGGESRGALSIMSGLQSSVTPFFATGSKKALHRATCCGSLEEILVPWGMRASSSTRKESPYEAVHRITLIYASFKSA